MRTIGQHSNTFCKADVKALEQASAAACARLLRCFSRHNLPVRNSTQTITSIRPTLLCATAPFCQASKVQHQTCCVGSAARQQADCRRLQVAATSGLATGAVRSPPDASTEREVAPGVYEGFWQWKPPAIRESYQIRYQRSGDSGPPALMVHGFGGNWCDAARCANAVLALHQDFISNMFAPCSQLESSLCLV